MKALRLRLRSDYRGRWTTLDGVSRERRRSRWNILRSMPTSITLASVVRPDGRLVREQRLPHERGALQQFLARCEPGSPVAVETIGNWYWIVDEIEAAGCLPKLVHARKAN